MCNSLNISVAISVICGASVALFVASAFAYVSNCLPKVLPIVPKFEVLNNCCK